MKDLNRIYDECVEVLKKCGIYVLEPRPVLKVNTKAGSRWGQSKIRYRDGYREINLASALLEDDADDYPAHNTMIHEILHQLCPSDGHCGEWKILANKVNTLTCYNITRCTNYREYNIELPQNEMEYKYVCKCSKCGVEVKRKRMSDFVKKPERYGHPGCSGHFERIA